MTWQQFLTEKVLKECWHEGRTPFNCGFKCRKCGNTFTTNRTFDNRNDLIDLYEAIERDGKWEEFFWDFAFQRKPENYCLGEAGTVVWLFCLSGEGYEDRCKMIAEFYGWEEKMGQYI